jgi:hypothetical protein
MLLRSWRKNKAQHTAFLEDYGASILGFLSVYQSDPQPDWFETALMLSEEMIEHYQHPQGGFYDTRDDQVELIFRPRDFQDNATPSGNALAATALLQLSFYQGRGDWREIAERMLANIALAAIRYPTAFACWLCAADFLCNPVIEVAITGDPAEPATQELVNVLWSEYRPDMVAACAGLPLSQASPILLHDRQMINNLPTAYVCENMTCQLPVNKPEDLHGQLERKREGSR